RTLEGRPHGRGRLLAAHALVAVGVLAKGPVILGLYGVPLVLAARTARPRVPLASLRIVPGALLVLLLAAPWFAAMAYWYPGGEGQRGFVREHFGHFTWSRATSDDLGGRPFWFYLLALAGDYEPWVLVVPFAFAKFLRRARDGERGASEL